MWRREFGRLGRCFLACAGLSVTLGSADTSVPPCLPDQTLEVSRFGQYQSTVLSVPPADQQRLVVLAQQIAASFKSGCTRAVVVTLTGHTDLDPSKKPDFHIKLSRDRAATVGNFLLGEINKQGGAPAELLVLHPTGLGDTQLKFPSPKTMDERLQNRRVILALTSVPGPVDQGFNRPGADYDNFPVTDIAQCHAACQGDPKCKAYTFVKPGTQEPGARCWVKLTASPPAPDACCISWAKPAAESPKPQATGAEGQKPQKAEPGGQKSQQGGTGGQKPLPQDQLGSLDKAMVNVPGVGAVRPGQALVKWKSEKPPVLEIEKTGLGGLRVVARPERTSGNGDLVYQLIPSAGPDGRFQPQGMQALATQPLALVRLLQEKFAGSADYIEPVRVYFLDALPGTNDPESNSQWHFRDNGSGRDQSPGGINLPAAWKTTKGSHKIVVAVIDTGIVRNHPDISGANLLPGYDMISSASRAGDGDGRDSNPQDLGDGNDKGECLFSWEPRSGAKADSWHGTHVAGIIGVGDTNNGKGVAGINWNVKVLPIRALGKCGFDGVDVLAAIRWAAGVKIFGPKNPTPAHVVNLSLGTDISLFGAVCSRAERLAIDDAIKEGAILVASAGNDRKDMGGHAPGACDGVIAVAASDALGNLASRYSNFGKRVDILAPGGDLQADLNKDGLVDGIVSLYDPHQSGGAVPAGYGLKNGTSQATPHVSGVLALWLAQDPELTLNQLLLRLKGNALPRNKSQCPKDCGAGLLNANPRHTKLIPLLWNNELIGAPLNLLGKADPITDAKLKNKLYFFMGSHYSRYHTAVDPTTNKSIGKESLDQFPRPIDGNWNIPWKDWFDAAVLWPDRHVYFFRGSEYLKYDPAKNLVVTSPRPVSSDFKGLPAGGIDAGFVLRDGASAYFFKGSNCYVVDTKVKGVVASHKLSTPSCLPGLTLPTVEGAVLWPEKSKGDDIVFFFQGSRYAKYNLTQQRNEAGPRPIKGFWPPQGNNLNSL